jgi:serine/threonine-protein kinase
MHKSARDRVTAWLDTQLQTGGDSTILPTRRLAKPSGALEELAKLGRVDDALELKEVIGRGGMGEVREATQLGLGRVVAAKSLQGEFDEPGNRMALVREAWATGCLEHPNIVPVHALYIDGEGRPILVLKKIAGVTWALLMFRPQRVRERFHEDDLLAWNLEIFLHVLDAVRFAHSRGVIHRDLKPSNVMIGEFGEVYLLDWGIAVGSESADLRLPRASEVDHVAGTPSYMAPEMISPQEVQISEKTDVYLLGAILYEILSGEPPHAGESANQVLASVARGAVEFPPGHPEEELVEICLRATKPDPANRFASADEMREAVVEYMQHRGSARLARRAQSLLSRLHERLREETENTAPRRVDLYNIFAPCRFGFEEALRTWPDNPKAQEGLAGALSAMVNFELSHGEPSAAEALLAGLKDPPAELQARVTAALGEKAKELDEAQRLRQRASREHGGVGRRRALLGVGLGWTLLPLGLAVFYPETSYVSQTVSHLAFLVGWLVLGFVGREWVASTSVNRRTYRIVLMGIMLAMISNLGMLELGIAPAVSQVFHLFVFLSCGIAVAGTIEWRFWPSVLAYLGAFLLSARDPDLALWTMAVSNAILTANVLVLLRRYVGGTSRQ